MMTNMIVTEDERTAVLSALAKSQLTFAEICARTIELDEFDLISQGTAIKFYCSVVEQDATSIYGWIASLSHCDAEPENSWFYIKSVKTDAKTGRAYADFVDVPIPPQHLPEIKASSAKFVKKLASILLKERVVVDIGAAKGINLEALDEKAVGRLEAGAVTDALVALALGYKPKTLRGSDEATRWETPNGDLLQASYNLCGDGGGDFSPSVDLGLAHTIATDTLLKKGYLLVTEIAIVEEDVEAVARIMNAVDRDRGREYIACVNENQPALAICKALLLMVIDGKSI